MEDLLNVLISIVKERTRAGCPLDTTCIHNEMRETILRPITASKVFERITSHNLMLTADDEFGSGICAEHAVR